jgi:hypothetical protein
MTSEPFEEFRAIATVINEARGELRGLLSAVENLKRHLEQLTHLVGRALDQAESVSSRAAKMADDAAAAVAARSANADAVRAELQALRQSAREALR